MAPDDRSDVLRDLLFVRRFEERVGEVYDERGVPELPHLSIGQEAVGVGAIAAIRGDDWIAPSLRTRAAMLLRVPTREVVAGMFGTASGPSEGRTTQHHMGSTERRVLGTTGMVGSHLNPAAGAGLAARVRGTDEVCLAFLGDGAVQRGEFHTALNFAAVNDLPTVFVIENNGWTEMTPAGEVIAADDLAGLSGNGLPSCVVDGQDADAVFAATKAAVERARAGEGPTLVEAKTRRFRPHAEAMPDPRDDGELGRLRERDPVDIYRSRLLRAGAVTEDEIEEMEASIRERIDDAFAFAADDPLPDEAVMFHVYKDVDVAPDGTVVR